MKTNSARCRAMGFIKLAPEARFGVGDTIGAGLNLKTGKGFVTLNGTRMYVGKYYSSLQSPITGFCGYADFA